MNVRLGGWQRLGIIVSVFLGLVVGGTVYIYGVHQYGDPQMGADMLCATMPPGDVYLSCHVAVWEVYIKKAEQIPKRSLYSGLATTTFTLLIFCMIPGLSRWVRRGFEPSRANPISVG